MSNKIFDQYQSTKLLPPLGGADDIYEKLIEAAVKIAKDLTGHPAKIQQFALVAFDSNISEQEPVLEEIENAIKTEWQMLRSQLPEQPITLYRAVMLQVLENLLAAEKDKNFASIIYLSVIDIYPFLAISHKEEGILRPFLEKIGDAAEDIAIRSWTIDKKELDIKIPTPKADIKIGGIKIDEDDLKTAIYLNGNNANNYGVSQWIESHYPKLASGIASTIESAVKTQNESINTNLAALQKDINSYFTSMKKNLQTALQDTIQSSVAVERRSQLLWWKETLYSRSLHKSYRKLNKLECAIAMAFDLSNLLPEVFPVSVDYILREAFGKIHGTEQEEITLLDFFKQINDTENETFLKNYFNNSKNDDKGRVDLLCFVEKVIFSKVNIEKELSPSIGVSPDKTISYQDISVWILHCLSVNCLTD